MKVVAAIAVALASTPSGAQTPPVVAQAAAPDPTGLTEARLIAAKLLPPGVYRTVMRSALEPLLDSMGDSLKALPLKKLAEMGGLSAEEASTLDKVNIEKVMAIYDPHWRERSQLTMRAMFEAMGQFFTTVEPELREAYAHAYANRFSLAELRDLNAFFATPVGTKYATQYMTVATDPAIATQMKALMPEMMQQLPTFVAAGQKATASLPQPRKLKDLTVAERAELAKALGVAESQLKDPKSAT